MTLTTDEAAARVGVSPQAVRMWVLRGDLNPIRRGVKPLRFHEAEVIECRLGTMSKSRRKYLETLASQVLTSA